MKEHEYSFKVKNLKPYIDYCINNKYELEEKTLEQRIIYRKNDKTMARITIIERNGKIKKILDFKEDKIVKNDFNTRKESLPLEIKNDNVINSILDFLNYKKDNTLYRNRLIFKKGQVKFELDEYISPEKCFVVAIEGDIDKINTIYKEIKKFNE